MTKKPATSAASRAADLLGFDQEEWRPVPGYRGYEVSDQGQVVSRRRSGTRRTLRATVGPCGFRTLTLSALVPGGRTQRVGNLVALAFIGPPPSHDSELRRLDGNPMNDCLENLMWGTIEEVRTDHAARARRDEAAGAPTHCPAGHRYADSWLSSWGQRDCAPCRVASMPQNTRDEGEHPAPVTACMDCGAAVQQRLGAGPWFKRCPACRRLAEQEYQRRYKAKATPRLRMARCKDCGTPVLSGKSGPLAKRCAECRRLAAREADARWRERRRV